MIHFLVEKIVMKSLSAIVNAILVNLIAMISPKLFLLGFKPLMEKVNNLFEKKKKSGKFPEAWEKSEKELISLGKQMIHILEK